MFVSFFVRIELSKYDNVISLIPESRRQAYAHNRKIPSVEKDAIKEIEEFSKHHFNGGGIKQTFPRYFLGDNMHFSITLLVAQVLACVAAVSPNPCKMSCNQEYEERVRHALSMFHINLSHGKYSANGPMVSFDMEWNRNGGLLLSRAVSIRMV